MNILITGGSGFIGFRLAKFHAEKGDNVIIFDSLYKSKNAIDDELKDLISLSNVEFYEVDLTREVEVSIQDPIDYVYHLAAINGTKLFYEIPYELCLTNLLITINFLKFLEKINFSKLIFSSTSEVYAGALEHGLMNIPTAEDVPVVFPQPTNVRFSYASSKFVSEYLCSKNVINVTNNKSLLPGFKVREISYGQTNNQTSNSPESTDINFNISEKKLQCEAIGFTPKTEKFADCVLKLVELDMKNQQSNNMITSQNKSQSNQFMSNALLNLGQQLLQPNSSINSPTTRNCTVRKFGNNSRVTCY